VSTVLISVFKHNTAVRILTWEHRS